MSSIRNKIRQDIDNKFQGIGISFRISIFYTLYFSVVVFSLFGLAYLVISLTTEQSEITKVSDRLSEYRAWNRELGLKAVGDRFLEQGLSEPENLFLRIYDGSGTATLLSTRRIGPILDGSKIKDLPIDHTEPRMYLGFNPNDTWTVVSGELAPGIRIQVGKSNRSEEVLLRRFRKIFLWSAIPTALVGLLLGVVIGYQSMAPVRNLNYTITSIGRTGDLSRRVPLDSGSSELNEVGASFNELLSKQEHLVSAMRDSLSNVSHDLRTPLARLRATLETGASEAPENEDRWGEGLEECDKIIGMLDTFLELGAAESGVLKLDSEQVDIGGLAENAADFYELVAEDRKVKIETVIANETPAVNGDRGGLLRMITNLVGNAVKFSPENSVVSVRVGPENDRVVIEVTDRGPGIPKEEQAKIWQRLYRGDSSRNTPGLGLGLSFVKAIAEAHGGSAEVSSDVGKGSTFRVELPTNNL
jgi:signal transduction histidine kinase